MKHVVVTRIMCNAFDMHAATMSSVLRPMNIKRGNYFWDYFL